MNKFCSTTMMAVFLLLFSNEIPAQTIQSKLNQMELMKQLLGTWQSTIDEGTVQILETKLFGKAVIITVTNEIKGEKSPVFMELSGFDDRDGKIKGFLVFPNGKYVTWIGQFITENTIRGNVVDNFNPEVILWIHEYVILNPKEIMSIGYDSKGIKTGESKFSKVE
ncbi:MAG: hypothetical protein NTZ26_06330 [Candidatus Aminicenantes bacterium]|nr:hypothetical protein [Candidatus Aminicenantes bacterium]